MKIKNNFEAFNFGFGDIDEKVNIYDYSDRDGSTHASLYHDVITKIHRGNVISHEIEIKKVSIPYRYPKNKKITQHKVG